MKQAEAQRVSEGEKRKPDGEERTKENEWIAKNKLSGRVTFVHGWPSVFQ